MLRQRLRVHNRRVFAFAALCAAGAVLAWTGLYGLVHWLVLLGGAITRGPYSTVPRGMPIAFLFIAAALLFSAWLDRRLTPNEVPPDDKSPREIAMDFLLALPRMTLAITGNLSAWQRLSASETSDAAIFMERLIAERRIPIHQTPLDLPDPESRDRILNSLMMLGLVELQHEGTTIWLRVPPAAKISIGFPVLE
jgi:hypothetical protein